MKVTNVTPLIKLTALVASSVLAIALTAPAFAADGTQSGSPAGSVFIALAADESDSAADITELNAKMGALDTLFGQFKTQLDEAKKLSAEVAALQSKIESAEASRSTTADVDYEKLLEDAASDFEQRVATESGGALTADLALELQDLLAARKTSIRIDDLVTVSTSLAEMDEMLARIDQTVAELNQKFEASLDAAVKAGYDLATNKKV